MNTHYVPLRRYGKFLLLSTWLFFLWPDTYAQNLLSLGQGVAMDAEGRKIETMAKFSGGIAVNSASYQTTMVQTLADPVNVMGDIIVDPADVGKTADIFVYADATLPVSEEIMYFMLGRDKEGNLIIPLWDKHPSSLEAFIPSVILGSHQLVPMYSGKFIYPGTLKVHFGYRLENGTIAYNEQPIDITINPGTPKYDSTPPPETTFVLGSNEVGKPVFQNLIITEVGDADLQVKFDSIDGTNADVFKVAPANFDFTIADGAVSPGVVEIQCTPTFIGEHTARLTVKTNDPGQPVVGYTLQCNGVGSIAGYFSDPASGETLTFAESASFTQQITVAENGNATLEVKSPVFTGPNASAFKILAPEFPLEIADGGAPQTVTIQCSPQGAESLKADLIFSSNDPKQPVISYSLSCQGSIAVYASNLLPNSTIDFGSSIIGGSLSKEITIEETGNADLVVNLIGIVGSEASDFKVVSPTFPLTIADGGVATKVTVQCTPQEEGARTAQLQFGTNDPKLPTVSYSLACIATETKQPAYGSNHSPGSSIDFWSSTVGESLSKEITIEETGNADLVVNLIGITDNQDNEFTLVSPTFPLTIADGGMAIVVKVQCTPQGEGLRTAQLQFGTNDPNLSVVSYSLNCVGTAVKQARYSSNLLPNSTIKFGSQSLSQEMIIAETGNADLVVNLIGIDGTQASDFAVASPTFPLTILDGGVATVVKVQCTPQGKGSRMAQLQFETNDPNLPTVSYSLDCDGIAPTLYYKLTVTSSEEGKVTSTPTGIDCGTDCTEDYVSGTPVTLTATANANATFKEWSGACTGTTPSVSVIMEANKTCTATFEPVTPPPALTVMVQGDGKVTSTTAGIDCGTDCTEDYASGTQVTLTATAVANSIFKEWSGACSGTSATTSVTMEAAKTCTATFEPDKQSSPSYPLTITLQGEGEGKVASTPTGIECGTDCTEDYASGTQVTLTATANANATFKEWSGDCAGTTASVSVTMDAAKTCTATFDGEHIPSDSLRPLTATVEGTGKVISDPSGIDCDMSGTNCIQNYSVGSTVTLTAETTQSGVSFQEWSGACTGTNPVASVTVDAAKICTATFTDKIISYPLTIIVEGNGQVAGTGIDCGADCMEDYPYGSSITLTATPASGYFLNGWSGNCAGEELSISIDIDSAKECVATFEEIPTSYPLAITVDGAGQVDVQGNLAPTTRASTPCTGSYCNNDYVAGESLTLTAIGSSFKGWSGSEGCTGTNPVVNVIMDENTTCSAIFAEGQCPVSNTASTCSNLDAIPIIPSDQAVLILGTGIDSDRDQPRPFSCLNGTTRMVGGSSVSMKVKAFTSYKEVLDYELKSVKGNLKFGIKAINVEATAGADFIKFYDAQSKSRSYLLKYELNMTQQFTPDPTAPLNQYGLSYTADACQFKQYCGDQFVWQQNQGVKLYVAMAFSFDTIQAYQEFTAKASAGVKGTFLKNYCDNGCLKQLPIPFSADLEAQLTKMSTQTTKNGKLSITFYQEGGEPQKTAGKAGSAITCNLQDMKTCKAAFQKVMDYVGSEEFIRDAKASPVIFNSTYSPYSFIPEVPPLPSDLTPEIENAREQLAAEYVKRKLARDEAQSLLDSVCYTSRKSEIEPLAERLANDVNTLEQTLEGCFSDLGYCVENKCKAFQTLQSYDLSTVQIQPEELLGCGLVAYYPFDGDTKDQVSGQEGTPSDNGPSLTTGVSGEANEAYQFNGENTHIGMKPPTGVEPALDFTISAWFKIEKYNQNPDNTSGRSAILDLRGDGGSENKSYALFIDRGDGGSSKLAHRSDFPKPDGYNFNVNVGDARQTWHHTALVREGDYLRIYYDGVNQQKDKEVGTELLRWNDWRVGKRYVYATNPGVSDPGNFAFNGAIDQIRIYNRALSDEEIGKLYELKK